MFGRYHGFARHDEGLFQSVLPFQNRMAHAICKDNPARIRRELPASLPRFLLEPQVLLHRIVAAVHEPIVRRTMRSRNTECSGQCSEPLTKRIAACPPVQPKTLSKMRS